MRSAASRSHLGKTIVIALSLVAAGFFVAWLRFRPHLATQGVYSDGARHYEGLASEPIRYAVWDEVVALLGEEDSTDGAHRPTLSPGGRWLVFAGGERGLSADLWLGEMVDGEVRDLRPLYELNTTHDEVAPAFGDDALYFASDRPGGAGGFDLWRAPFADGTFGAAEPLGGGINGPEDEIDPAPLPGGAALAFASDRGSADGRGHDLFLARPGTGGERSVERLPELCSPADDREPAFTRDGRRIVFASDRNGERGSYELFGSLYELGAWLPPTRLEGLDDGSSVRGPAPLGDGFSMLFEAAEPAGVARLYRASSVELFPHPGRAVGWLDLLILATLLVLALLAWLAKRWDRVEFLYKCFLVSVIAHGLLLWWLRGVHPEVAIEPLPAGSRTYAVRLVDGEARAAAAARERGGRLEVAASSPEAVDSLELWRAGHKPRPLAPASPRRPIARAAPIADALPESSEEAPRAPRRESVDLEVALADAPVERPRREGHAPPLSLSATDLAPSPAGRAVAIAAPEREASETPTRRAPAPVARPGRPRERVEPEALPVPEGIAGSLRPSLPAEAEVAVREVEAAGALEAIEGAAAELVLPGFEPAEGPARPGAGEPERAQPVEPVAAAVARPTRRPALAPADAVLPEPEYRPVPVPAAAAGEVSAPPLRAPVDRPEPARAGDSTPELARAELSPRATPIPAHRGASEIPLPEPARFRHAPERRSEAPETRLVRAAPRIAAEIENARKEDRFEHTPYRARFGLAKARALEELGGGVETEAAVARGLAYLASRQRAEGYWGDPDHFDDKYGYVLVGKTGLALLAFLGAGHTQSSGTEHSEVVEKAVEFLVAIQGEDSGHFGGTAAYSHGIATYALAEDFAMTADERLRGPLESAVAQILRHQNRRRNDPRRFGGWSYYYPTDRRYDSWPRVSITAWQVMALESARLGGLEVPDRSLEDAREFLLAALDERRGWFRYCHDPGRLNSAYPTLPGSTPAALFALSLLGEDLRDERYADTVDFLLERAPRGYRFTTESDFVHRARGNLYFWYYGSLAMLRYGGRSWRRWNETVKETLLEAQRNDGSWEPISVYAEYAGDQDGDAVYSTGMGVLVLEVYYRYFTPLLAPED